MTPRVELRDIRMQRGQKIAARQRLFLEKAPVREIGVRFFEARRRIAGFVKDFVSAERLAGGFSPGGRDDVDAPVGYASWRELRVRKGLVGEGKMVPATAS